MLVFVCMTYKSQNFIIIMQHPFESLMKHFAKVYGNFIEFWEEIHY